MAWWSGGDRENNLLVGGAAAGSRLLALWRTYRVVASWFFIWNRPLGSPNNLGVCRLNLPIPAWLEAGRAWLWGSSGHIESPKQKWRLKTSQCVGYVLEAKGTRVSVAAREPGSHRRSNWSMMGDFWVVMGPEPNGQPSSEETNMGWGSGSTVNPNLFTKVSSIKLLAAPQSMKACRSFFWSSPQTVVTGIIRPGEEAGQQQPNCMGSSEESSDLGTLERKSWILKYTN